MGFPYTAADGFPCRPNCYLSDRKTVQEGDSISIKTKNRETFENERVKRVDVINGKITTAERTIKITDIKSISIKCPICEGTATTIRC